LLDSSAHNAGAILMPKYAELLRNRSSEHSDVSFHPFILNKTNYSRNRNTNSRLVLAWSHHHPPTYSSALSRQPLKTTDADLPLVCLIRQARFHLAH
jgi:hypothetical protein